MTLPLELGGIHDDNVRHALELIAQKFPLHAQDFAADVLLLASTGTQRKVALGTSSNTFTASTQSAVQTVSHGLGTTPVSVVASCTNSGGITYRVFNFTATTFDIQAFFATTASATVTGCWIAIG